MCEVLLVEVSHKLCIYWLQKRVWYRTQDDLLLLLIKGTSENLSGATSLRRFWELSWRSWGTSSESLGVNARRRPRPLDSGNFRKLPESSGSRTCRKVMYIQNLDRLESMINRVAGASARVGLSLPQILNGNPIYATERKLETSYCIVFLF